MQRLDGELYLHDKSIVPNNVLFNVKFLTQFRLKRGNKRDK